MAKIVIFDLHPTDADTFLHDLNPGETNTLLGGFLQNLLGGYSDVLLTTIHHVVDQQSNSTYRLAGVDNNKLFTADFSKIAFNLIIV
ncbi:hypothetical protein [Halotia branconii]|uniref:Uncharacterized protein n=1 Tax=Halotia branconii CENA392 TaxID=1539056 RepID=A0AAJ6NXE6_9CYAN|nr:hypothetical protein [Halotia branconii]WGV28402.1 hypothetical protein QI031_13420 [Halotia branconii CENA392]